MWGGRGDNERVAAKLAELAAPRLLWTGGEPSDAPSERAASPPTYVLLDGTWQEAREMLRKGPAELRSMTRLTLAGGRSYYRLRKDHGWRARFGADVGSSEGAGGLGGHLMCTSEVVQALLAREGDATGEARLRALLDRFQSVFVQEGAEAAAALVREGTDEAIDETNDK